MNKTAFEVRAFCSEVRAAPVEEGQERALVFEGYAARFNTWSEDLGGFREQIAPGAFREAVETCDVRMLLNHDANYVLGRTRSGTLELAEDAVGLRFTATAPDTQWARDLYESVRRGDIDQCSFGFEMLEEAWTMRTDGPDERVLRKVNLYDVSIVTYPAYRDTMATARSMESVHADAIQNAGGERPPENGDGARRLRAELYEKIYGREEDHE